MSAARTENFGCSATVAVPRTSDRLRCCSERSSNVMTPPRSVPRAAAVSGFAPRSISTGPASAWPRAPSMRSSTACVSPRMRSVPRTPRSTFSPTTVPSSLERLMSRRSSERLAESTFSRPRASNLATSRPSSEMSAGTAAQGVSRLRSAATDAASALARALHPAAPSRTANCSASPGARRHTPRAPSAPVSRFQSSALVAESSVSRACGAPRPRSSAARQPNTGSSRTAFAQRTETSRYRPMAGPRSTSPTVVTTGSTGGASTAGTARRNRRSFSVKPGASTSRASISIAVTAGAGWGISSQAAAAARSRAGRSRARTLPR